MSGLEEEVALGIVRRVMLTLAKKYADKPRATTTDLPVFATLATAPNGAQQSHASKCRGIITNDKS